MRAVIQRVKQASVSVSGEIVSEIERGLLVLVGFAEEDGQEDSAYIIRKIESMRIFPDGENFMNLSVKDYGGDVLIVSQFTLYGDARKGRRPSFSSAMKPEVASDFYVRFLKEFNAATGIVPKSGIFAADMDVELTNWGPVTILLDSKKMF